MVKFKSGSVGGFVVFILLLAAGVAIFLATQTDFFQTTAIVPPMPTFNDCSAAESEIAKYDWDTETATAIMKAESQCRADAYGDEDLIYSDCALGYSENEALCQANQRKYGYSVGLFQIRILPGRESCDTYDMTTNVSCAYDIYLERGRSFEAWSGYTTGKYLQYTWHTLLNSDE